jgi:ATP-binding cassette subfamily G (WHITE) protein 2 (SNQ2)
MQVRIVMLRRIQMLKGNYFSQILTTSSVLAFFLLLNTTDAYNRVFTIQGVIIGTTFVRMTDATAGYFSRGGVLFLYVFLVSTPWSVTNDLNTALFSHRVFSLWPKFLLCLRNAQ